MGRAAASLLLMDTSASKMRHYISFTPEIIVRGSTAQPREA
jgi:DNA-binding LacI/PurR family transcriptional regulator